MKRLICILLSIAVVLQTGCGAKNIQDNSDSKQYENNLETDETVEPVEPKYSWNIEEKSLPDADEELSTILSENSVLRGVSYSFFNGTVYRTAMIVDSDYTLPDEDYYKGCCIQILKPPYSNWETYYIAQNEWMDGEKVYPWSYSCLCVDENGTFYTILKGDDCNYVGKWNNGERVCVEFDPDVLSKDIYNENFLSLGACNDVLYFFGYENHFSLELHDDLDKFRVEAKEGVINFVSNNPFSGDNYFFTSSDTYFEKTETADGTCFSISQNGLKIMDKVGEIILETEGFTSGFSDRCQFISDSKGYLYQSSGISLFSLESQEIEYIYDFINDPSCFAKMAYIVGGYSENDNKFTLLVSCKDGNYEIWNMSYELENRDQKVLLEWAVGGSNGFYDTIVANFNKQSSEYRIEIIKPGDDEEYQDFVNRIQSEITTGGGPDLVEAYLIDGMNGVRQGYILDLADEFDEYGAKVLGSAREVGTYNEKRYAIPFSCTLTTLVVNDDYVKNLKGWNSFEAISCICESDINCFIANAGMSDLFYYMTLQADSSSYLDLNNNNANFTSDTAMDILSFCSRYADLTKNKEDLDIKIGENKAAGCVAYIMTPQNMEMMSSFFNGKDNYIGFPTKDGSGHLIDGYSISVNAATKNKDGAIEFIHYLLSENVQNDIAKKVGKNEILGFPVLLSSLENLYKYLRSEDSKTELDDFRINKLKEMLENATPIDERNIILFNIIEDEFAGYKDNDKDAWRVLEIIENRANLYLNEQN